MTGKKLGQVEHSRLEQDAQIAAVNHAPTEAARFGHQRAEVGIELGRPSGEIEQLDLGVLGEDLHHA